MRQSLQLSTLLTDFGCQVLASRPQHASVPRRNLEEIEESRSTFFSVKTPVVSNSYP